jgi:Bacterial protein of unknown function (DUF885)
MSETALDRLVDRFLAHHATFNPVDATFMGLPGHDSRLPLAGREAAQHERDGLVGLLRDLDGTPVGDTPGQRLDARMLRAALIHAAAALDHWPRLRQPSWYTGEVAFGIISLLLPTVENEEALSGRLDGVPAFLDRGAAALAGQPTPTEWCERAQRECRAIVRLLTDDLPRHPVWTDALARSAALAAAAVGTFAKALTGLPPREPACGRDYLALLMRDVHGLPWSPEEAVALARDTFDALGDRIAHHPARHAAPSPMIAPSDLPAAYRYWHDRALAEAAGLVTPAAEYGLSFQALPEWVRAAAADLYFLSYRCPPALAPGTGSIYWTASAEQPAAAVKQTHAVHHGSIGHHTQNTRARAAPSRLARLAGTDCASGIAFLAAGTMVEGWSCYATELIAEVPGFYTPADELASLQAERRNAASVLADIGLHAGGWGLERMREFYREEGGFPEARIAAETTRNSILPATRLMYFLGTTQIKALRREIGGPARSFHDDLLGHGHVPLAWAAEELRAARGRSAEGHKA